MIPLLVNGETLLNYELDLNTLKDEWNDKQVSRV